MSTKQNKPRNKATKAAAKKPAAAKRVRPVRTPKTAAPALRKASWAPAKDNPHPIGRALHVAVAAFKGDKGALAEFLGVHRPNLSRALTQARAIEAGKKIDISWPVAHVLGLAKVSGVPLHEMAPSIYEPQMKVKRVKIVDGKPQAAA